MEIDLEIGDIVLGGKFKNKRMKVKTLGVDDIGQPTINGRGLLKVRLEKLMPREKWSAKSREKSEKKVKITEKQLRNLVKQTLNESLVKQTLNESTDRSYNMQYTRAPMPLKSRASKEFTRIIKEDRVSDEGKLLAELSMASEEILKISEELYGLVDPMGEDPGGGDQWAELLEVQVERLNKLFDSLEAHFESSDAPPGRSPGYQ